MICTKCNSEVPNGAKFCPVCGNACGTVPDVKPAAASAEPEKKNYCQKCGLELRQGAKFCAVCGAPTAGVGDIKPTQNDGATFGQGDMSAVSLIKPHESDSLVAAMNTAAAAPSAAPAPSGSVPMPSNSVPMPSNSIPTPAGSSGFSTGISGTGAGYASPEPAPAFIPETPAPMGGPSAANPLGDMGAAAVAVTPVKKKGGVKVGLIIAIAVVVILAAGVIFFFTNKATALSLVMGKPGYATMVEGNSIKNVTEKLDTPAISEGIKSASSLAAAMYSINNGIDPDDLAGMYMSNTVNGTAPMMSSYGEGVDFKSVISSYHKAIMESYGMNSIKMSLGASVELAEPVKTLIGSDIDVDELLDIINSSNITVSSASSDSALAETIGVTSGGATINAKVLINDNGELYISLPFVSDTAMKIKLPTTQSAAPTEEIKPLELDEKEITRIIGEMVEIYLEKYKASAIEMEGGELSAAGLTATGKLITAEFAGKDLSGLFRALAEHFADDEYFTEKIVGFAKECGADITEKDYKDAVSKLFENDAEKSDKLIISTVIDNNGNVLAKSFNIRSDVRNQELVYVDNKEQFTLEVFDSKKTVFSLSHDITSDSEGSFTFKCSDGDDGKITVTLKYSELNTAKFCGKDTPVGTYTVSVEVPEDFTQNSGNDVLKNLGTLSNVKLTVSNKVDSENTMESTVSVDAGGLCKLSISSTVTAADDDSELKVPADIIDCGDGSGENIDTEAVEKQIKEYFKKLEEKLKGMSNSPFGGLIEESGIIDGIGDITADKVSPDDIIALNSGISGMMSRVSSYSTQYNVNDSALSDRRSDLVNELYKLFNESNGKGYNMTSEEYNGFMKRFNELSKKASQLEEDYKKAAQGSNPSTSSTPSGSMSLNFDAMSYNEVGDVLNQYGEIYYDIITGENSDKLYGNSTFENMLDNASDTYDKAVEAYSEFANKYVSGQNSDKELKAFKDTTKAFVEAVNKLRNALAQP